MEVWTGKTILMKFLRATWSLLGIGLEAIHARVGQTLNSFISCLENMHEDELKSSGLGCLAEELSGHYYICYI